MEHPSGAKKHSPLKWLLLFFILSSVGVAGFVSWKNIQIDAQITDAESSLDTQDQVIKKLLENEQVGEKTNAQDILAKAEKNRIEWSSVAADLLTNIESEDIELDRASSGENLFFTTTGRAKDLRSIARLIDKMKRSPNYEDPFVSGFSQNSLSDKPYNFSLNFYYQISS